MTWSRGMSRMSGILLLSYRLKEVINSFALHCFWCKRVVYISRTKCLIEIRFGSKCSILNGQWTYIEKSKLKITDMWLIPLGRATFVLFDLDLCYISPLLETVLTSDIYFVLICCGNFNNTLHGFILTNLFRPDINCRNTLLRIAKHFVITSNPVRGGT